jgi:hypothetical protein
MRCYCLCNSNGDILITSDAGYGSDFSAEAIQEKNPTLTIMEITPEEYETLGVNLKYYKVEDNKIKLKEA